MCHSVSQSSTLPQDVIADGSNPFRLKVSAGNELDICPIWPSLFKDINLGFW